MQKIGVIPNLEKDKGLEFTKKLLQDIEALGCTPIVSEKTAYYLRSEQYAAGIEELYRLSDFLVVMGGDGTLLNVSRKAALYGTPILGINLGTLGFLTDVEKEEAPQAIRKVIAGDYKVENRMMLEAGILTQSAVSEGLLALNEVCITRGVFSKIVSLEVYVNQEYLDCLQADGLIIATPTGSTAYNLSAGGPILKPDTGIIAITPICSHTLHSRSIVVSDSDVVLVKVGKNSRGDLLMSLDGQPGIQLKSEDVIQVRRSKFDTSIIKTNHKGFYEILRSKMEGR